MYTLKWQIDLQELCKEAYHGDIIEELFLTRKKRPLAFQLRTSYKQKQIFKNWKGFIKTLNQHLKSKRLLIAKYIFQERKNS